MYEYEELVLLPLCIFLRERFLPHTQKNEDLYFFCQKFNSNTEPWVKGKMIFFSFFHVSDDS